MTEVSPVSQTPQVTQQVQTVTKVFAGSTFGPDESKPKDKIVTDTFTLTIYDRNGVEKRVMQASTIDILV